MWMGYNFLINLIDESKSQSGCSQVAPIFYATQVLLNKKLPRGNFILFF